MLQRVSSYKLTYFSSVLYNLQCIRYYYYYYCCYYWISLTIK